MHCFCNLPPRLHFRHSRLLFIFKLTSFTQTQIFNKQKCYSTNSVLQCLSVNKMPVGSLVINKENTQIYIISHYDLKSARSF